MSSDNIIEKTWAEVRSAAEVRRAARQLAAGYADWNRRRKMRVRSVCSVFAAIVLVGGAFAALQHPSRNALYGHVCSNRSAVPERYWVGLADEMLIEELG